MNMPKFTAESSLCKARRCYGTGRQSINVSSPTDIVIHPALPEVIDVRSCKPGYSLWEAGGEWGCALVEPPPESVPSDDGHPGSPGGNGGPGNGATTPGHVCSDSELNGVRNFDSKYTQIFNDCRNSGGYLRCIPIKLPVYGNYGNQVFCCKKQSPRDSCNLIFTPPTPPRISTSIQVV
jgi:hypothetical protein